MSKMNSRPSYPSTYAGCHLGPSTSKVHFLADKIFMLFIVGPYRSMCALTADMACWLSSSIPSLFPTVSDMAFHQVCNGQGRELSDTPLTCLVPVTAGACRCAVRLNMTVHHIGDAIYGLHSKWAAWYCHRHHGPQLQARLASVTALLHLRQLHASWHGIIIPLQSLPWPPQATLATAHWQVCRHASPHWHSCTDWQAAPMADSGLCPLPVTAPTRS